MSHGHTGISDVVAPRSSFYQGPFGRIFRELEPWSPPGLTSEQDIVGHFLALAQGAMVEFPGQPPAGIDENSADVTAFTSQIPAGYTYFGQFIDHDITFDPVSSLMRQNDPAGLLNHRTPRFDLDNVYGRGPSDSPYLYDQDQPGKLLTGMVAGTNLSDLPRNSQGRALIGDMRNDENAIVSQLQLAFLKAHNELVDRAGGSSDGFETARTTLRWLYQYIVWNDFVARITIADIHAAALVKEAALGGRTLWRLGMSDVYDWRNQPYMPVEFSVAAYRFGHSLVRNAYQTNEPHRGFNNFAPIFDNSGPGDPDDCAASGR